MIQGYAIRCIRTREGEVHGARSDRRCQSDSSLNIVSPLFLGHGGLTLQVELAQCHRWLLGLEGCSRQVNI